MLIGKYFSGNQHCCFKQSINAIYYLFFYLILARGALTCDAQLNSESVCSACTEHRWDATDMMCKGMNTVVKKST